MEIVAKGAARQMNCPKGFVVNMSLGGTYSKTVNEAAANIVKAGLFLAIAASNYGTDASGFSPTSEKTACTVGATTRTDALALYSNVGAPVDVLAPGSNITSLCVDSKTKSILGTSMALPHIAGLAAYLLGTGQKVDGLCDYVAMQALKDTVSGVPSGTKILLANNGYKSI